MIIDGIEYEDEPSYTDAETGKPVYYAKDIPKQIRRSENLTDDDRTLFKELEALTHLERLQQGNECWNHWIKVGCSRWLDLNENEKGTFWTWANIDQVDPQWREIDFHPNRPHDLSNGFSFRVGQIIAIQSVFPCSINLSGAECIEEVSFSGAVFHGRADFVASVFHKAASFAGSHFYSSANFLSSRFCQHVAFSDVTIDLDASFTGSTFNLYVYFTNAKLNGRCDFSGTNFYNIAYFSDTTFGGDVRFGGSRNGNRTTINGIGYSVSTLISGALFWSGCHWENCRFNKIVSFEDCYFLKEVVFSNCHFEKYANFDYAWFGKGESTPNPAQYEYWDESVCGKYDAATITSNSVTVPNFKGAVFHVAPNLGYTNVPDIPPPKWVWGWTKQTVLGQFISRFWQQGVPDKNDRPSYAIKDGDAAAKLRVLGELAARGHHHLAEKRFFRAELLARRGWETKNGYEVAMINAFEIFSKCGLSFWRPMVWLVGVMIASALFYSTQINWFLVGDNSPIFELFSYSIANSLPLLGYISDSYEVSVDVLFGGIEKVPGVVRAWAFMQNVVSAILIFFGLLAIRNYFKLG